MQDALQRYMDDNRMCCLEGQRGIDYMEKVMSEVCGYGPYNTSVAFFADNPGAIEAVIEWIGKQRNADWKDNLDILVEPVDEILEDFEPNHCSRTSRKAYDIISREGWDG